MPNGSPVNLTTGCASFCFSVCSFPTRRQHQVGRLLMVINIPRNIIVGDWKVSQDGEIVRVQLQNLHGRNILNVWRWYLDNGTYKAGEQGIAFDLRHIITLVRILKAAKVLAKAEGYLEAQKIKKRR